MKAQELLIPRYEVIGLYPNSPFSMGQIIIDKTKLETEKDVASLLRHYKYEYHKYPNIFRKMNWWENREDEEMPKKLKSLIDDSIYEIELWDNVNKIGFIDVKKRSVCDLKCFKPEYGYIPFD